MNDSFNIGALNETSLYPERIESEQPVPETLQILFSTQERNTNLLENVIRWLFCERSESVKTELLFFLVNNISSLWKFKEKITLFVNCLIDLLKQNGLISSLLLKSMAFQTLITFFLYFEPKSFDVYTQETFSEFILVEAKNKNQHFLVRSVICQGIDEINSVIPGYFTQEVLNPQGSNLQNVSNLSSKSFLTSMTPVSQNNQKKGPSLIDFVHENEGPVYPLYLMVSTEILSGSINDESQSKLAVNAFKLIFTNITINHSTMTSFTLLRILQSFVKLLKVIPIPEQILFSFVQELLKSWNILTLKFFIEIPLEEFRNKFQDSVDQHFLTQIINPFISNSEKCIFLAYFANLERNLNSFQLEYLIPKPYDSLILKEKKLFTFFKLHKKLLPIQKIEEALMNFQIFTNYKPRSTVYQVLFRSIKNVITLNCRELECRELLQFFFTLYLKKYSITSKSFIELFTQVENFTFEDGTICIKIISDEFRKFIKSLPEISFLPKYFQLILYFLTKNPFFFDEKCLLKAIQKFCKAKKFDNSNREFVELENLIFIMKTIVLKYPLKENSGSIQEICQLLQSDIFLRDSLAPLSKLVKISGEKTLRKFLFKPQVVKSSLFSIESDVKVEFDQNSFKKFSLEKSKDERRQQKIIDDNAVIFGDFNDFVMENIPFSISNRELQVSVLDLQNFFSEKEPEFLAFERNQEKLLFNEVKAFQAPSIEEILSDNDKDFDKIEISNLEIGKRFSLYLPLSFSLNLNSFGTENLFGISIYFPVSKSICHPQLVDIPFLQGDKIKYKFLLRIEPKFISPFEIEPGIIYSKGNGERCFGKLNPIRIEFEEFFLPFNFGFNSPKFNYNLFLSKWSNNAFFSFRKCLRISEEKFVDVNKNLFSNYWIHQPFPYNSSLTKDFQDDIDSFDYETILNYDAKTISLSKQPNQLCSFGFHFPNEKIILGRFLIFKICVLTIIKTDTIEGLEHFDHFLDKIMN